MPDSNHVRVLIAEDMHMIRGALVALLSLERDIEVVAQLDRGDTIVEAALRSRPDVAVVDIDLPGLDGLAAADLPYEPRIRNRSALSLTPSPLASLNNRWKAVE